MNELLLFEFASIGAIRRAITLKKRARATPKASSTPTIRLVRWTQQENYVCIQEGTVFHTCDTISQLYQKRELSLCNFFIWRNKDPNCTCPNDLIPKYEAVYKCVGPDGNTYYYKAQKCHLAQAYENAGRTGTDRMFETLEDDTPYYVDRRITSLLSVTNSRSAYNKKQKV